jgi:hypothetical protein
MSNTPVTTMSDAVLKRGLDLLVYENKDLEEFDWLIGDFQKMVEDLNCCWLSLQRIGWQWQNVKTQLSGDQLTRLQPVLASVFDEYGRLFDLTDEIENDAFDHVRNVVHNASEKLGKIKHGLTKVEEQLSLFVRFFERRGNGLTLGGASRSFVRLIT